MTRQNLIEWQFPVLEAQFILFAALTWLCLPALVRALRLPRGVITAGTIASVVAGVIVIGAVPRTNRIYFDEHIYQGIAQNMADLHLAQSCNEGSLQYGRLQCDRGEYNKQPYGYPYVLSLLYRIGGTHEVFAHWLNAAAAMLFVWVVLLVTCALWNDPYAAGFAALVAAMIPQHLLWSGTAAAEPTASLMAGVAVLSALHFVRARTTSALLWMVVSTVFAMQWRPEVALVAVVVSLVVVLFAPDALRRWPTWWATLVGAILSAVWVQHWLAVGNEPWGATAERMSFEHVWPNLLVNGAYFVNNARFPVGVTVLAAAAIVMRRSRATLVAAVYFLLFWGVFLFFYAGSYDFGADIRFALMAHAPVAMLAGVGASALHELAVRRGFQARASAIAIAVALAFHFLSFMPQVRAVGEEAWAARADVEFVHRIAPTLPPHSMVLTQNPSVFHIRGISASQMSVAAADPAYVSTSLPARYTGGVFLHWNYWCNVQDDVQRTLCKTALGEKAGPPLHEYEERDYRYAFYRLDTARPRLLLKME